MYGLSWLGAFWLVHGTGRWSWRLPLFLAGFALLWSAPVWIWQHYKLPGSHVPIIALGIAAFSIPVMTLPKRGLRLQCVNSEWKSPEGGREFQLPLRDLLLIMGAIGLLIAVAKLIQQPTNLQLWLISFGVVRCWCQAFICIIAAHTALQLGRLWRYPVGLLGIAILSVAAPVAFHDPRLHWWWVFATIDCTMGLYVLFALLLVRRQGWRLV
jgi:hypothetical protein